VIRLRIGLWLVGKALNAIIRRHDARGTEEGEESAAFVARQRARLDALRDAFGLRGGKR